MKQSPQVDGPVPPQAMFRFNPASSTMSALWPTPVVPLSSCVAVALEPVPAKAFHSMVTGQLGSPFRQTHSHPLVHVPPKGQAEASHCSPGSTIALPHSGAADPLIAGVQTWFVR
jgi:hypothetical protein